MVAMREILFGTTNEAKVKQVQGALTPIGVRVRGVADATLLPAVTEDGSTAAENARKKALAYAAALHTTVLSMDNALYFDSFPSEQQPGLNVRRIDAGVARPSDDDLLRYYSALVGRLGGTLKARWEFAFCIASPERNYEETIIISPRIFTSVPSDKTIPGYPLESIQLDPVTGKYISEMSQNEQDVFWQHAIGEPLQEFVKRVQI